MTNIEKVKHIREITMSPMTKINAALLSANGDVGEAIAILVKQKETSVEDMANRKADNSIVYSYVHNNKIGAMIVLASQTDFVAKNELFTQLAKDICMHVVSNPNIAEYVVPESIPSEIIRLKKLSYTNEIPLNKPEAIRQKIIEGKIQKYYDESCLMNQKFIKDDSVTIRGLITKVSGIVGEKIEIKNFVRLSS